MKNLLLYVFAIVIAVAFIGGTDKSDFAVSEERNEGLTTEEICYYTDSDILYSDLCIPRQSSFANVLRMQRSFAKRTNHTHKYNFESVFSRDADAGTGIFNNQKNLISHHRFIKSVSRLISLGKLII